MYGAGRIGGYNFLEGLLKDTIIEGVGDFCCPPSPAIPSCLVCRHLDESTRVMLGFVLTLNLQGMGSAGGTRKELESLN